MQTRNQFCNFFFIILTCIFVSSIHSESAFINYPFRISIHLGADLVLNFDIHLIFISIQWNTDTDVVLALSIPYPLRLQSQSPSYFICKKKTEVK